MMPAMNLTSPYKLPGHTHVINVGHDRTATMGEGASPLDDECVERELLKWSFVVVRVAVSDTGERTTVAVGGAMSPVEYAIVAQQLGQQAIAVRDIRSGEGELYGPQADLWRPFNPSYFLNVNVNAH